MTKTEHYNLPLLANGKVPGSEEPGTFCCLDLLSEWGIRELQSQQDQQSVRP